MRHQRVVQSKAAKGARERNTSTSFFPRQTTHAWDYPILHLQRTIGNQAVQGLIQAKLKIGQPGDKYEQQADRVAERVMRMPAWEVSGTLDGQRKIQRKCAACASGQGLCPKCSQEEEGIQRKPLAATITPLLQRQSVEVEKEEEEEFLQTKEVPGRTAEVTPALEARLSAIRGGGEPLAPSVRSFMEPRFGHDLSDVRIHRGGAAVEAARSINARVFTLGRDVVFGKGQFAPETFDGKKLLAHELTHVVQQRGADRSAGPVIQRSPA